MGGGDPPVLWWRAGGGLWSADRPGGMGGAEAQPSALWLVGTGVQHQNLGASRLPTQDRGGEPPAQALPSRTHRAGAAENGPRTCLTACGGGTPRRPRARLGFLPGSWLPSALPKGLRPRPRACSVQVLPVLACALGSVGANGSWLTLPESGVSSRKYLSCPWMSTSETPRSPLTLPSRRPTGEPDALHPAQACG